MRKNVLRALLIMSLLLGASSLELWAGGPVPVPTIPPSVAK